ncbi:MAG: BACON domain-containing protein, partial [Bacteroidales bacterium]|nr:BACON domain-containing protein [Bacteroidales bacterium]
MKRLFPILLCGLAFLIHGCNTTPDPVLTVTPENLAFSAEGGAQTVQVKANNPWTASASGSGLSVNPSSGDGDATVTVTATATSSTNPLSGSVTFR